MSTCLVCLEDGAAEHGYHPACLEALFGTPQPPRLEEDLPLLQARLADLAGGLSISGVQPKALARLCGERLLAVDRGGTHVLKPPVESYPSLPENEHTTMILARHAGLLVPPCGLVRLRDGRLAYLISRFDRTPDGRRLLQDDFAALAGVLRGFKYQSSAEACADLLRRYAAEPEANLQRLFLTFAFSYWAGNGDLHLKNLSLLERPEAPGSYALSPAYDLLCTRLVLPRDRMALPLNARTEDLKRSDFVSFGSRCGLSRGQVDALLDGLISLLPRAEELVRRSFLPEQQKPVYVKVLQKRSRALRAGA